MKTFVCPALFWLLLVRFAEPLSLLPAVSAIERNVSFDGIGSLKKVQEIKSQPFLKGLKRCGRALLNLKVGQGGIIQSPNYPKPYESGLDCEWRLRTEKGSNIIATFFDVRIAHPSVFNAFDYLVVSLDRDGKNSRRISGDMNDLTPFNLISKSDQMYFKFKSDPTSLGSNGFRIGYYVRDSQSDTSAIIDSVNSSFAGNACQSSSMLSHHIHDSHNPLIIPEDFPEPAKLNRKNANPHLVAMILDEEDFCAGTLIRNDFVLTSAHCTHGVRKIDLIFGSEDFTIRDSGVQKRIVSGSAVTEHPYFDMKTGTFDISLIHLSEPVRITQYVKPVLLPDWTFAGQILPGFEVQIAGWGRSQFYNKVRTTTLRLAPSSFCRSSLHADFNGLMMCSQGGSNVGTCQVDTGTPVTVHCNQFSKNDSFPSLRTSNQQHYSMPQTTGYEKVSDKNLPYSGTTATYSSDVLLGIVSFGSCEKGFVFTRITAFLDFLKTNMQMN